jgi:CubicO group peptidase (beta-lactamase class C family)
MKIFEIQSARISAFSPVLGQTACLLCCLGLHCLSLCCLPTRGLGQKARHGAAVAHERWLFEAVDTASQKPLDFSRVDTLLRDSLSRLGGGCALVLIHNGRVVFERGYGSVKPETVLPIASASKWLSAALLLTMVDDGRLRLTDSIGKYLQYLSGRKAAITVAQAFSHTSGFAGEIAPMRNTKLTMKNAVYAICKQPLRYAPGAGFAYGGASMQIGGRIVEIVGKNKWEYLFQERIAQPLGMKNTSFYGAGFTDNPLVAGSAKSSAKEYAIFLQMIAQKGVWQGRRVLSEEAIKAMFHNHAANAPILREFEQQSAALSHRNEKAQYGLGVWLMLREPLSGIVLGSEALRAIQTEEIWEAYSQGRYGFSPWIDFRRNLIGVFSVKAPLRAVSPTYQRMKAILREIVPLAPPEIAQKPVVKPPLAPPAAPARAAVRNASKSKSKSKK